MSIGSDETLGDPLVNALLEFTECIGQALPDLCSYGLTVGESYVPFLPDEDEPDCDDDCSQMWVRVAGISPAPGATEGWAGDCALTLRLTLEVGVVRCVEVPEDGEAPYSSDVLVSAVQSMADMKAIQCAAVDCDAFDTVLVGAWNPLGPRGAQYGGSWTFQVEV